ncbi:MAG TPA: hypothetical protein VEH07_10195 [Alphaproteobacteria bacterium]|nr:hypothetical protein [Alphaproteobacteria bacterium]
MTNQDSHELAPIPVLEAVMRIYLLAGVVTLVLGLILALSLIPNWIKWGLRKSLARLQMAWPFFSVIAPVMAASLFAQAKVDVRARVVCVVINTALAGALLAIGMPQIPHASSVPTPNLALIGFIIGVGVSLAITAVCWKKRSVSAAEKP